MLIKRLAAVASLGLALCAGACGDDDTDNAGNGDSSVSPGQGDGGGQTRNDGGVGNDIDGGRMDGAVADGGGSTGPGSDGATDPGNDASSALPDGALADGSVELDSAVADSGATLPDTGTGAPADAGTSTPDAGPCSVNNPQFGCGTNISATWVRYDNGIEVDTAAGLVWAPPVTTVGDTTFEEYCLGFEAAGMSNFRAPEVAELRTIARGCVKTETGGACTVTSGLVSPSGAGDCTCLPSDPGYSAVGPHASGGFCRPEVATCETIWTSTYCGTDTGECANGHWHWFYDVRDGSIVRVAPDVAPALGAKGRCVAQL